METKFLRALRLLLCLSLLPTASLFAQKEGNIWYYGAKGLGLDFNSNPVQPLRDGKMPLEGFIEPFVMADPCGNLLFYSNSFTVWNKEHQVMQNGNGLLGSRTGQAVVALPHPSNPHFYFLFTHHTTRELYPVESELRYSLIDMQLDNGRGGVIEKNKFLYKTNTNHMTVIRHANNRDFWLITSLMGTDKVLAFIINEQGLQSDPVVSTSPYPFTVAGAKMRASPDGRKIAVNSLVGPENPSGNTLFYFDNSIGKVTKAIPIKEPTGGSILVEFSPDSRKLYWAYGKHNEVPLQIAQYQLASEDAEAIYRTKYSIPASAGRLSTDIRLAPDGKIYLAARTTLDVIENPNATGDALQYRRSALPADASMFPNNIAGFTIGKQKDFLPDPACAGEAVTFRPKVNYKVKQWFWNFADPASGAANTSQAEEPVHQFSGAGTYQVQMVTLNLCDEYDTLRKEVVIYPDPVISFPADTITVCYAQAPVPLSVAAYPLTRYHWSTGDTVAGIQTERTGWYKVTASNPCRSRTDSVFLLVQPEAKTLLPDDTIFCEGNIKVLDALNEGAAYEWSTGETTRTIEIRQPGRYWVRIKGACNEVVDTSNVVFVREDISAFIPNVFTPNGDGYNDTFYAYALNTPDYRLAIYNRWGAELFRTNSSLEAWDGRVSGSPAPPGVYYYLVTATDCRGKKVSFKGYVSLLR